MSQLTIKLATIDGEDIGAFPQFDNLEVEIPWLDSRTGSVDIPMNSYWAKELFPVKRLIKVYYGDYAHPAITGHILQPRMKYAAGTVSINFHDPTLKLKHHYHRFGDIVVDKGYPVDGRGMRRLVESSIPSENQLDRGVKSNGISWGTDLTAEMASEDDGGIWGKCRRGENVWETVTRLAQKDIGPDFEFEPRDGLAAGKFVRLRTGAKIYDVSGAPLSVDHTDPDNGLVVFTFGVNADDFEHAPDGNAIRNVWVAVNPGGQKKRANAAEDEAVYHSAASQEDIGLMEGWESVGEKVPLELLEAEARERIRAYKEAPEFFNVLPRQDAPNVPKLFSDFKVGDFIKAAGRRYGIEHEVSGQIVKATITQAKPGSRQAKLSLECVPVPTGDTSAGVDDSEE